MPQGSESAPTVRFIIISCPPAQIGDEIETARRKLNEKAGSTEALRYPPHITLRTGMICPADEADAAAADFLAHAARHTAITVETEGISCMPYRDAKGFERGLLAHRIVRSEEILSLHSHLLNFTRYIKGAQQGFHPHLTLAFHDITHVQAQDLWAHLSPQDKAKRLSWRLDEVSLYHEVDGGWVEYASTGLS